MALKIQQEPFSRWCREAVPLFEEHWLEVGTDRDKIKLNVDFEKFFALERLRVLASFSARLDEALIGYAVFICSPHLHYKDHVVAFADIIFVSAEYRKTTGAGLGLIRFAERTLRSQGVSKVVYHMKLDHDFMPVLHKCGYEDRERMAEKLLI